MYKQSIFPLVVFLLMSFSGMANDSKDLLQASATIEQLGTYVQSNAGWVKYPSYSDRKSWDNFTGKHKKTFIEAGEKALKYEWKVVKATDYLEFERSGSRIVMEQPFTSNVNAMAALLFAELAEGKGRFIDQIINGVWQACDMSTWVLSAHLPVQRSKRSLQEINEQLIDLTSGDVGSLLSWTHYFLSKEFDKVNPVIAARLRQELNNRVLNPYLNRNDLWWQALQDKPGQMVNNWNPWCNFNVLTCFLLLENDRQRLISAVYKTMKSTDQFINYTKADGACEEGPSYWGHAAGKLYDYLALLKYATNGKVDIFSQPKIRNMGEYIARSYIGDGWVVNFADASAQGGGSANLIYRFGNEVKSNEMMGFAAYMHQREPEAIMEGRDIFRTIENLVSMQTLETTQSALPSAAHAWYPQTEFCYMRQQKVFFAAKGGFNNESHNHNDVGTFMLFADNKPFIIDAGVGTYTRQTFSNERYNIWTMQSDYHNLPMANGFAQSFGAQYRSKDATFDSISHTFSLDIANAYTPEAGIKKWELVYKMDKSGKLDIKENFDMAMLKGNNKLHFLSAVPVERIAPGILSLKNGNQTIQMLFDAKMFDYSIETITLSDIRLSRVWGQQIYRISLTDKNTSKKGSYKISFLPQ